MAERVLTIEDIRNPFRPYNTFKTEEVVEVVEVAEEPIDTGPPLLYMGIEITFLKLFILFYMVCISIYAIAQQAKKESNRDGIDGSISFLLLLLLLSFFGSVGFACLLEYHTMSVISFP